MSLFQKEEYTRYSRQMMLPEIGMKGQEKIKRARVLVVGAGGLGCPALQYLGAAGIGTIGIIDFDRIELHNLHRQVLYTTEDIGRQKAVTAAEKLKRQNPHTEYVVLNEMLQTGNAEQIISGFDVVVDGSDNFLTRYLVNDTCVALQKPLVYGTILKFEGQLAVFNHDGSKNLRHIYPEPPNPEDVPGCDENGVLGIVPGVIGSYMALYTLRLVLGEPVPVNTLQLLNLSSMQQTLLHF